MRLSSKREFFHFLPECMHTYGRVCFFGEGDILQHQEEIFPKIFSTDDGVDKIGTNIVFSAGLLGVTLVLYTGVCNNEPHYFLLLLFIYNFNCERLVIGRQAQTEFQFSVLLLNCNTLKRDSKKGMLKQFFFLSLN